MKKYLLVSLLIFLILFAGFERADAVLGIPDRTSAATLLVPMFEVAINPAADSLNTLPIITNTGGSAVTVHYEVWDVMGNSTPIFGNFPLAPLETRPMSVRALIDAASPATKAQLTDGDYWRGFMTFDVVTASTALRPIDVGYPFSTANVLEGWIYYVRLLQGSSNGLSMVPIEATPAGTPAILRGFYTFVDDREAIDADARYSAKVMTQGGSATLDPDDSINRVRFRTYLDPANNGTTKLVLFTYRPNSTGGPGLVPYKRYNEAGALVHDTAVNLNRVVNVINVPGTSNGWVSIWDIPFSFHTYGFSINAASPGFNPALTWDAIFEAYINP